MQGLAQVVHHTRSADGVRLAYARSGRGPMLVLAGAWFGHLERDAQHPVWAPLVRALSERHQLVRYDARGCGLSDWTVAGDGIEGALRDLEAVADAAGARRFPLLGISQGAATAVAFAAKHPERVSRLVLHGAFARGARVRDPRPTGADEAETMARLAELGWGRADPAFRQVFATQLLPGATPQQHAQFNEHARLATSPAGAAGMLRDWDRIDVGALLPRVRCPTLVLHSRHDRRVPLEQGRLVASAIPDAEMMSIDSANHLPINGEPGWTAWLSRVEGFLAENSDQPADAGRDLRGLTQRQRDLVELIAQGRDNTQIAARLGLSQKTVRNHITAIFAKLQVENRPQAIVRARDSGYGALRA